MTLRGELLKYSTLLAQKGFVEEAKLVERTAHFVPENTENVPSFFRHNLDYGEGFYYGNMNEKPGIKEWLKRHQNKGPNFPKKKKKEAADSVHQHLLDNDTKYRDLWERVEGLRTKILKFRENAQQLLSQGKVNEAEEIADAADQLQAYLDEAELAAGLYKKRQGKKVKEQNLDELVEQSDRLINPKTSLDYFRIALLEQNYEEAGKLYNQMSPEEKKEAEELAKHYHKAGLGGFIKVA